MRPPLSSLTLLALILSGCGGGSGSGSKPAPAGRGKASIAVAWPSRAGRFVPYAANSAKVEITLGNETTTRILVREGDAASVGAASFSGLKYGDYAVRIRAFPTTDATGVAQAVGMGAMRVVKNVEGHAEVSLATTAKSISILPVAIDNSATATVSITALDENGAIVLLEVGGSEVAAWSLDATDPVVATFVGATDQATVLLKGVHSGSTTLRASVSLGGPVLTAPPASVTINATNDGSGTVNVS